jgi:tRNA A58 N-methylase Trm61
LNDAEVSDTTNSAACLESVAERMNKRGLVIIISDFFDDIDKVLRALNHFRFKKNDVVLFQILDPVEESFAFGRDAVFIDMETQEEMITQPHQIQKAYQESFQIFLKKIKSESLRQGIEYNLIKTSEPFDKALFAYLQKRSRLN